MKNAHSLLFHGYEFPLEDRPFLKSIAYDHMGDAAGQKFMAEWRETMRILSSFPGFSATYGVHVLPPEPHHPRVQVNEHITLVGDENVPFATLHMTTGPIGDKIFSVKVSHAVQQLEKALKDRSSTVFQSEYCLQTGRSGERQTLQFATLFYELRRTLLAHSDSIMVGSSTDTADGPIEVHVVRQHNTTFDQIRLVFTFMLPDDLNRAVRALSEGAA